MKAPDFITGWVDGEKTVPLATEPKKTEKKKAEKKTAGILISGGMNSKRKQCWDEDTLLCVERIYI